jgi:hypothetical protein
MVGSAPSAPFHPAQPGLLAIVGFVGMVHEMELGFGTLSRGRLRGPKRRKPKAHRAKRKIDLSGGMACVGAFRADSRGRH